MRERRHLVYLALAILASGCARMRPDDPIGAIPSLTRRSPLIFEGTVLRVSGSTLASTPPTARHAVVRIEEVFRRPTSLKGLGKGFELTLQTPAEIRLKTDDRRIFYTSVMTYGTSLLAGQVGRVLAVDEARKIAQEAIVALPDEAWLARVTNEAIVLEGAVIKIADPPLKRDYEGEHDPQWKTATIAVISYLYNDQPEQEVQIAFPDSLDIAWFRSPKAKPKLHGIWTLRKAVTPGFSSPIYTGLDPLDFQPPEELARLKALLSRKYEPRRIR